VPASTGRLRVSTTYALSPDGAVSVDGRIEREGELPPLARVGYVLQLPGDLDRAAWHGRGPHESYPDRWSGARVGVFSGTVAAQHFPHVMAQENGGHVDTRWLEVTDGGGVGLRAEGRPRFAFTVHDYDDAALLAAKTSQVVERDGRVTLHLDLAQMGLGGDDSWSPRVHPEYQLTASEYRFAFVLRGVGPAEQ
jgi:beta-galactosidase